MKIRKEFRVESAHIVRNCTSERCSHSIHGHSAVIEVFLESSQLDNAHMVYDFGLMKESIKQFIDSMDHCYLLCSKDNPEFKSFIKASCDRWIELPFNPSAEMLSLFVMHYVNLILNHTKMNNGESRDVACTGVRYHETTTGWAESDERDYCTLWKPEYVKQITFSDGVIKDWNLKLKDLIISQYYGSGYDGYIENPIVEQQIELGDTLSNSEEVRENALMLNFKDIEDQFKMLYNDYQELLKAFEDEEE